MRGLRASETEATYKVLVLSLSLSDRKDLEAERGRVGGLGAKRQSLLTFEL